MGRNEAVGLDCYKMYVLPCCYVRAIETVWGGAIQKMSVMYSYIDGVDEVKLETRDEKHDAVWYMTLRVY